MHVPTHVDNTLTWRYVETPNTSKDSQNGGPSHNFASDLSTLSTVLLKVSGSHGESHSTWRGKANLQPIFEKIENSKLRDATRHRTGRSAWEEFLQKTGCKMIWIVEDRPFGGLAYGVWRDMARSLAGTCVSTVSTYFGITRRFSTVGPVGIANCQLYSDCFTQTESYQSPVPDSVLQAREHQAFFQVNVLTCKWSRWGITNVCDILWLCFQHSAWCKIC